MSESSPRPQLKAAIVPVTPLQQNCTLIWNADTKLGAVVDPGGDLDRIEAAMREVGMTAQKILLTHGHVDHASGADELRQRLGVRIEGPHRADQFLLDSLAVTALQFMIAGARNVTPDRWLEHGDTVEVAGLTLEILHCPGHSPGSVVYLARDQGVALVGDVLFRGSIGRTDLPGGDHAALISAIKTKLLPLGDHIAFVCGHGPTSTFGAERQSNPFLA